MDFLAFGLSEDKALFAKYNQLFSTRLTLATTQEPLPLFVPRADYFLSQRCMVTGQPTNEQTLASHFEAKLLKYARVLANRRMFWRHGRTVDLTSYMLFFPQHNLRYLWIPKNANTTIKAELLKRVDPEFLAQIPIGGFHETINAKYRISIDQLAMPNVQEVAFVRHPVERLISCYFDKFARPLIIKRNFEKFILRHIAQIYKAENIDAQPEARSVSFAEFLFYVLKQPAWTRDAHWRPQSDFLGGHSGTKLYPIEGIDKMLQDVGLPAGDAIEKRNMSAEAGFDENQPMSGKLFDRTPDQISAADVRSYNEFVSPNIYGQLKAWLKEDFELFDKAH